MRSRSTWLALLAIAGCQPHRTPRSPDVPARPRHAEVKAYKPFDFAVDDRIRDTAVIFGIDDADHSLVLPLTPTTPVSWQDQQVEVLTQWPTDQLRAERGVEWALEIGTDKAEPHVQRYVDAAAGRHLSSLAMAVGGLAEATSQPITTAATTDGYIGPDGSIIAPTVLCAPVDLADAYQRATGSRLPETVPIPASEMTLDACARAALAGREQHSWRELARRSVMLARLDNDSWSSPTLARAHVLAERDAALAASAHQRGDTLAAYVEARRAIAYLDAIRESRTLLALVHRGDVLGVLRAMQVRADDVGVKPALRTAGVSDARGPVDVMIAANVAWRRAYWNVRRVQQRAADPDLQHSSHVADEIVSMLVVLMQAQVEVDDAVDEAARVARTEPAFPCTLSDVIPIADSLEDEDVQAVVNAYGIDVDTLGRAATLRDAAGLQRLLEAAERHTRAMAHAQRIATGEVSGDVRLLYQMALVDRDGDVGDRIAALVAFWRASGLARNGIYYVAPR